MEKIHEKKSANQKKVKKIAHKNREKPRELHIVHHQKMCAFTNTFLHFFSSTAKSRKEERKIISLRICHDVRKVGKSSSSEAGDEKNAQKKSDRCERQLCLKVFKNSSVIAL